MLRHCRHRLRLGRRRGAQRPRAVLCFLEMHQQVGEAALDRIELGKPRVGRLELFRQLGDAILERAERELIALAQLRAVEPLAQFPDRAFELRRHGAAAFHHRRDALLQPGQRLRGAFRCGALELRRKAVHLGGKLRQRSVGGDVGDHAA
jgi:hypothetical protein